MQRNPRTRDRTPILLAALAALAGLAGLATGCGESGPTTPSDGETFESVIATGGDFEPVEEKETETVIDSNEFTDDDGTRWKCTTKTIERTQAPDRYKTLDPNSEIVWPGALVQGETIADATPEPIDVKRAGGTISIDLINGSQGVAVAVPEMTQSNIRTAMNQIIRDNNGIGSANFNFTFSEVQSREQLAAALNINVKTLSTEFDGRVKFTRDDRLHRVLVKLDQVYYTMSWDRPTSLADIFAPAVTPSDLDRFVGPGNPACFVSQVTYGRIFYLLVETTASREALSASVKATYNAAVTGGSIEGSAKYVNELENVNIQVFALGGDPDLALATFQGDFNAVRAFLTQGGDIATGRPLSYTLRAVKDNRTVYVKVNNTFDVEECTPIAVEGPSSVVWYSADYGLETDSGYGVPALRSWQDRWGDEDRTAVPRAFTYCGLVYSWGSIGSDDDRMAVRFQSWQDGTKSSSGSLGFTGLGFENTDYTVFVVARNYTVPGSGKSVWLTWGSSREAGRTLEIGYEGDNTVFVSHGGDLRLTAPTAGPSQAAYQLFTFRFSRTEGMQVYVNGALAASDPSLTGPITSFSGATLGSGDEQGYTYDLERAVQLSEFKVFGEALDPVERKKQEDALRIRYSL